MQTKGGGPQRVGRADERARREVRLEAAQRPQGARTRARRG